MCRGGYRILEWGAEVERQRRECRGAAGAEEGGVWEGGVPLPNGKGSGEGQCPLSRNFFNFLPRNGAFCEHSDMIRQLTRPVAISLNAC